MTILDSSKLKEFADDNFKFDENGRNFSKWVENTVGKGEIACYDLCRPQQPMVSHMAVNGLTQLFFPKPPTTFLT